MPGCFCEQREAHTWTINRKSKSRGMWCHHDQRGRAVWESQNTHPHEAAESWKKSREISVFPTRETWQILCWGQVALDILEREACGRALVAASHCPGFIAGHLMHSASLTVCSPAVCKILKSPHGRKDRCGFLVPPQHLISKAVADGVMERH